MLSTKRPKNADKRCAEHVRRARGWTFCWSHRGSAARWYAKFVGKRSDGPAACVWAKSKALAVNEADGLPAGPVSKPLSNARLLKGKVELPERPPSGITDRLTI